MTDITKTTKRWTSFKRVMDATDFADNERDAILDAACKTFDAIADVSDEVTNRPA